MGTNFAPPPAVSAPEASYNEDHHQRASAKREPLAVPMVHVPEWLGISRSKAYEEIAAGRLKAVKCGSKTLISYASGRAWLDALPALSA